MLDDSEVHPSAQSPSDRGHRDFRFSAGSTWTTATVNTLLPQYSPVADDNWDSDVLDIQGDNSHNVTSRTSGLPPRYSAIHSITLTPPVESNSNDDAEAGVQSHNFQYLYPLKSTKPWATLLLHSRDAVPGNPRPLQSQPKVPRIWGCEPLTGCLDLELDSPLTIQQINIIIKGKITASALDDGSYKFLDYEFNLWNASADGLPGHNRTGLDGKLMGSHSFPFYVPFPKNVDPLPTTPSDISAYPLPVIKKVSPSPTNSSRKGEEQQTSHFTFPSPLALSEKLRHRWSSTQHLRKQYIPPPPVQRISHLLPSSVASSLPQSFMESGVTASVKYQLSVQFVHGRFKSDSRITTTIRYIPASQPHPSSKKRRQAYEAGTLIPGPMSDPDGWFDLPTVDGVFQSVRGSRQSKIACKFYLAQPLSYSRGTVIPCFLTLSSNDSEALDSLSNPNIPDVKLIRRLCHFAVVEDKEHAHTPVLGANSYLAPTFATTENDVVRKTVHREVGTAIWWVPPKDVLQETHVRHLEGEIHLNPNLEPSCSSQVFNIQYFVQMFSLQSTNFEQTQLSHPSSDGETVIASLPVDITTLCRLDEPLPIPFTEPSDTTMRRVPRDNADLETAAPHLFSSGFL